MSEVRVTAHLNGVETDITEGVKCLYDLVIGSMDWTSGFWTVEDALPVAGVARACGFPNVDEVDAYLLAKAEDAKRREENRAKFELMWEQRKEQERHVFLSGGTPRGVERPDARLLAATAAHDPAEWDLAFTGDTTNDHGHAFEQNGTKCIWPGCTLIRIPKGESDDSR